MRSKELVISKLNREEIQKIFQDVIFRDNGCWDQKSNYRLMRVGHFHAHIHKIMYAWICGKVNDGQVVRHYCNNPRCINPEHLVIGTHWDNMQDLVLSKSKIALRGELHPKSILTEQIIFNAIDLLNNGLTIKEAANILNINHSTLRHAVTGKTWKYLNIQIPHSL